MRPSRSSGSLGALAAAVAVSGLLRRYRRDLALANARLAAVDRKTVSTAFGAVEYVERGDGEPLLLVHGIFQGCDSALLLEDQLPRCRLIVPSRFGYVGSDLPVNATPADQADAFVALLDSLGIDRVDVVGVSAGATSALQLALRHPERVAHLVLLSGNLPGSPTAAVQPRWARLLDRQLPLWLIKTFAPALMARLVGVPRGLPRSAEERRVVRETIAGLLPVSPRLPGALFDMFVSNADVNRCDLEAIAVPTLLFHARDDPLVTYPAAERAARRIPDGRLVSLDSGGHLLLGGATIVKDELATFLSGEGAVARPDHRKGRRAQCPRLDSNQRPSA